MDNESKILDSIKIIREMLRERNRFLQELANLIVQSANVGLTTVDSQVLLNVVEEHNKRFTELNDRIAG